MCIGRRTYIKHGLKRLQLYADVYHTRLWLLRNAATGCIFNRGKVAPITFHTFFKKNETRYRTI